MGKKVVGRPFKCTAKVIEAVAAAKSLGLTDKAAAWSAGISASSLCHWLTAAREERERIEAGEQERVAAGEVGVKVDAKMYSYLKLLQEYEGAWQDYGISLTQVVHAGIEKGMMDPRLALAILERRFPDDFTSHTKDTDQGTSVTVVIGIDPTKI
jgi:hypothetical protein